MRDELHRLITDLACSSLILHPSSLFLLLRVLYPLVGWPQGLTGCRPPEVLPSPPPSGWSTGFIDTPRLWGRLPMWRVRPALPTETFSCSRLPTCPMVA